MKAVSDQLSAISLWLLIPGGYSFCGYRSVMA
jgi:hypothetical protein